jgi:hypothetical protein
MIKLVPRILPLSRTDFGGTPHHLRQLLIEKHITKLGLQTNQQRYCQQRDQHLEIGLKPPASHEVGRWLHNYAQKTISQHTCHTGHELAYTVTAHVTYHP